MIPRFTLSDLLLASTLTAIGVAIFCWIVRRHPSEMIFPPGYALLFGTTAFLGAGVGALLQRKKIGAVTGMAVAVGIWFVFGALSSAIR